MTESMKTSTTEQLPLQQQHGSPQRRLPPEDFQCTEMAHAVFGRSVGQCYGSFPCTYTRQHGRLYIAKRALLFYSNLFGYEYQLCMSLSDVIGVKVYRTTSIYISMMDGEDLIFKSLSDRQLVMNIIDVLLQESQPPPPPPQTPPSLPSSPSSASPSLETSESEPLHDEGMMSPPPPPPPPAHEERIRSQSCPVDMANHEFEVRPPNDGASIVPSERKPSNGDLSISTTSICTERMLEAWNKLKQTHDKHKNSKERTRTTTVDKLKLDCSMNDFFDTFLADDAPHSIPSFQEEQIGDSKLQTTKWLLDQNNNNESMTRTIHFCHPITNNYGMGPSSTMATRTQRVSRFGDFGIFMESRTVVQGVPAADCFEVIDRWIIENNEGKTNHDSISLTVLYETVFTKRTMLKRMIESSTQTEIKRWYKAYVSMLLNTVQKQTANPTTITSEVVTPTAVDNNVLVNQTPLFNYAQGILFVMMVIFMLTTMIQNYNLQLNLQLLRLELMSLKEERTATLQLVQEVLQQVKASR